MSERCPYCCARFEDLPDHLEKAFAVTRPSALGPAKPVGMTYEALERRLLELLMTFRKEARAIEGRSAREEA